MAWYLCPDGEKQRAEWFRDNVEAPLQECNLIFADPDNGLCENENVSEQHIPLCEVLALAQTPTQPKRPVVIYHRHNRGKKYNKQIVEWRGRLGEGTLAIRLRTKAFCSFFIVHPTEDMVKCLKQFEKKWPAELHGLDS